ncbi:DUF2316 family protein [Staphylococcus carnosus]|uniref:DUF2316 family protein n=3 Tax=Staphylococcus carnosus TaxID=1281 RepID=B9DJY2_STACT|nr:DUF2316 family protein [Staphylococcus carnosus]ANZ32435.1 hypothetical protein BEK99_00550 [Staphylococcus carnosus]KKB25781.1 hypothetical protein VV61_04195 [Staphylococcus carnosus]KOR13123.1 hypothetical protein AMC75_07705 [Staphylococcus carnosus]POA05425.1 DUF2316 domain-containing protein [Staphylococcus carnosus]QPT02807.1 DUF2316 family protein [Staphylococcus carnosus]
MSLNKEQRAITRDEMQAHFEKSTLSKTDLADALDVSVEDINHVLEMKAPRFGSKLQGFIHLVWDVRDEINQNIRSHGKEPEPYTYLKGEKEDYWFLQ